MSETQFTTSIDNAVAENIVSAARTSLSDTLRSVIYFTPSSFDVLYVRQDLYDTPEDARSLKKPLVELEQVGFVEAPVRTAIFQHEESTVGPYEFTVRFHHDGFVVRTIEGDHGVLFTTDSMAVTEFEEAISAIGKLLQDR
ncbi:hypothetical protein SAMN04487948_11218 [Halogranum amylolyticum]|uniref:Uncharacterized protein n=1 Tax=Halogranum amylolyticum TaxID=660520 RepID=A0A1H8UPN6_9EURY|nr:hypothetical protein [Halogranum amylolyticum]SEP05160.1 hypothetical protein SAMN04487948_11218 [Halogranum amylolyticum]